MLELIFVDFTPCTPQPQPRSTSGSTTDIHGDDLPPTPTDNGEVCHQCKPGFQHPIDSVQRDYILVERVYGHQYCHKEHKIGRRVVCLLRLQHRTSTQCQVCGNCTVATSRKVARKEIRIRTRGTACSQVARRLVRPLSPL